MQKLLLVFLTVLSFYGFSGHATQANTIQPTNDRVRIQRRRIVLVRSRDLAERFPDRKTAVVTYPVISGLNNSALLRRVHAILDFKNIFDYSLKEYREDAWLTEFSYLVNYNKNYLLDITFTQSGMAAYPDEQSKHFLINLTDGRIVKALDVFKPGKINQIVALVDRQLQREIQGLAKKNKDPQEKDVVDGVYDNLKFGLKELDNFSVGSRGITFLYDAGFPHVIKALEPKGRYFVSYNALRTVIKRDGPLGQFIR